MSAPANRVAPWEDVVLRSIAVYKLAKAALFFVAALGVRQLLHQDVDQFIRDYITEHNVDPENRFLHSVLDWTLKHASDLTDHKIRFISYVAFFYAAIFALEGIGLYLRKHWAEYMVLISTGSLLPIEFYELYRKLAWWKFGVLVGNLLIIVYLIHRLRIDAKFKREKRLAEEARLAKGEPVAETPVDALDNAAPAPSPAVSTKSR